MNSAASPGAAPRERSPGPVGRRAFEGREAAACGSATVARTLTEALQPFAGWEARLELAFELRAERTVLASRRHVGPLAVQRPFYPEADGTCHAYVLHPPGGVVGGDRLQLEVNVAGGGAQALLTTPAATKFYRSPERRASQSQHFRVGPGSRLEWLPQENIVYDGADIALETRIELQADAELIAWEVTCLGRPAIAERLSRGRVRQRLSVLRDGQALLLERALYDGGSDALRQPYGLNGQPVVGTLVCVAKRAPSEAVLEHVREALHAVAAHETACTQLPSVLVCRYLGASTERAQLAFRAAWAALRVHCFGCSAVEPRIWAT
jgi:urease accessory protein